MLTVKNTKVIIMFSKIVTLISNKGYIINWIANDINNPAIVLVNASKIECFLFCIRIVFVVNYLFV